MLLWSLSVFALLATAAATNVQSCPGDTDDELSDKVQLSPCKAPPCILKKGKSQHITIKFVPKTDLTDVKNSVNANVFGVDVPFIGVDGLSICDKLYTENNEKVECPLKAGTEYIYKDSFPVLKVYPSIPVNVKWALQNHASKPIVCFVVAARIQ